MVEGYKQPIILQCKQYTPLLSVEHTKERCFQSTVLIYCTPTQDIANITQVTVVIYLTLPTGNSTISLIVVWIWIYFTITNLVSVFLLGVSSSN